MPPAGRRKTLNVFWLGVTWKPSYNCTAPDGATPVGLFMTTADVMGTSTMLPATRPRAIRTPRGRTGEITAVSPLKQDCAALLLCISLMANLARASFSDHSHSVLFKGS